jgi:hypothetical protein
MKLLEFCYFIVFYLTSTFFCFPYIGFFPFLLAFLICRVFEKRPFWWVIVVGLSNCLLETLLTLFWLKPWLLFKVIWIECLDNALELVLIKLLYSECKTLFPVGWPTFYIGYCDLMHLFVTLFLKSSFLLVWRYYCTWNAPLLLFGATLSSETGISWFGFE